MDDKSHPGTTHIDYQQAVRTLSGEQMLALAALFRQWATEQGSLDGSRRAKFLAMASDYEEITTFCGENWRPEIGTEPAELMGVLADWALENYESEIVNQELIEAQNNTPEQFLFELSKKAIEILGNSEHPEHLRHMMLNYAENAGYWHVANNFRDHSFQIFVFDLLESNPTALSWANVALSYVNIEDIETEEELLNAIDPLPPGYWSP